VADATGADALPHWYGISLVFEAFGGPFAMHQLMSAVGHCCPGQAI
jgi:hypothetical protein